MRFIGAIFFCAFLVGLSFYNADAHGPAKHKKHHHHHHSGSSSSESVSEEVHKHIRITCPKYNDFNADLANSINSFWNSYWWIEKMWNTPFPTISSAAQSLREVTLSMAKSDVSLWRRVALTASSWIWANLPQVGAGAVLPLCGFTKVINETIRAGGEPLNCDTLIDALDDITNNSMNCAQNIIKTSKVNVGCRPGKQNLAYVRPCYGNGEVYDVDAFWAIKGKEYPCQFQKSITTLAKSSQYQDRFIANIALASTCRSMLDFFDNFNKTFLFQAFSLQTVPAVEKYCCKSLAYDLEETLGWTYPLTRYAAEAAIAGNGCDY